MGLQMGAAEALDILIEMLLELIDCSQINGSFMPLFTRKKEYTLYKTEHESPEQKSSHKLWLSQIHWERLQSLESTLKSLQTVVLKQRRYKGCRHYDETLPTLPHQGLSVPQKIEHFPGDISTPRDNSGVPNKADIRRKI